MTELILFHHVQGLTTTSAISRTSCGPPATRCTSPTCSRADVRDDRRRHRHVQESGSTRSCSGAASRRRLPDELVYIGISLGGSPPSCSPRRARERGPPCSCTRRSRHPSSAARGPPTCRPRSTSSERDPEVLPPNGDLEAARALAAAEERVELFLYPAETHLFKDYDEADAARLKERVLAFLAP